MRCDSEIIQLTKNGMYEDGEVFKVCETFNTQNTVFLRRESPRDDTKFLNISSVLIGQSPENTNKLLHVMSTNTQAKVDYSRVSKLPLNTFRHKSISNIKVQY